MRPGRLSRGGPVAAALGVVVTSVLLTLSVGLHDLGAAPDFFLAASPPLPPVGAEAPHDRPAGASARRSDVLELAGSGSNLRVTRALAFAFATEDQRVIVHHSIGSTGGAHATLDGVIDVGLMSRPLAPSEAGHGLVLHPYARSQVVLAASADVRDESVTLEVLEALFRGEQRHWRDGRSITLLLREPGDSGHRAVADAVPGLDEAIAEGRSRGRHRVLRTNAEMLETLAGTPAAVGIVDAAAVRGHTFELRELAVVAPDGRKHSLPAFNELAFATLGEPAGVAARFIDFAVSEAGRRIVTSAGYAPPTHAIPLRSRGDRATGDAR